MARDRLHRLEEPAGLHHHAAAGGQVLQRHSHDVQGRAVHPGADDGRLPGLGLHRLRHQVGDRPVRRHGGGQPEVQVGAHPGRPGAVRQRHRARQLRRQDRGRVLQRADRHRPVQVRLLAQGQRAQAHQEHRLLAARQAVPGQRDLDRRARRQHPPAPGDQRPGPDRPVPRVVHGGPAEGQPGGPAEPVQLHRDELPDLQRARRAVPGRERAPGDLVRDRPRGARQGGAVRQRAAGQLHCSRRT